MHEVHVEDEHLHGMGGKNSMLRWSGGGVLVLRLPVRGGIDCEMLGTRVLWNVVDWTGGGDTLASELETFESELSGRGMRRG